MEPMRGRSGGRGGFKRAMEAVGALLYPEPPSCAVCGVRLRGVLPAGLARARLCPACEGAVPELLGPLCRVCGVEGNGPVCADCERESHVFFQARAYAKYGGIAEELIKAYKYQGRTGLLPILGDWLAEAHRRYYGANPYGVVVPVPMHPAKRARRGFNQAEELAERLRKDLRIRWHPALERLTLGSSQTTRTRAERIRALEGAFALASGFRPKIEGAEVVLVDDVLTTGGTADACARVLFDAGAVSVDVLTVAR